MQLFLIVCDALQFYSFLLLLCMIGLDFHVEHQALMLCSSHFSVRIRIHPIVLNSTCSVVACEDPSGTSSTWNVVLSIFCKETIFKLLSVRLSVPVYDFLYLDFIHNK
jgi:hypothetical protein